MAFVISPKKTYRADIPHIASIRLNDTGINPRDAVDGKKGMANAIKITANEEKRSGLPA
jgi:hypothetical protein